MYCVTGIRLSEGVALDLDSVTGPAGARRLQVTGKGKRDRTIPIQPGLEELIDAYQHTRRERHGEDAVEDPRAPLLVHYDATRLTPARVQYVVEQIYKRAGLRAAVPEGALVHALRHSFASIAVAYGTDVVELRDLLGHASLATTSRYLDAEASRLREAVAAHPSQRALDRHAGPRHGASPTPSAATIRGRRLRYRRTRLEYVRGSWGPPIPTVGRRTIITKKRGPTAEAQVGRHRRLSATASFSPFQAHKTAFVRDSESRATT